MYIREKFSVFLLVILLVLTLSGCKDTLSSADMQNKTEEDNTTISDTETALLDTEETLSDMEDISAAVPFRFVDALGEWHETTIFPEVAKHPYNWEYLKNDSSGIFYNDSNYTIRKGIDVSYHQGNIDWEKVKSDGYDFVMWQYSEKGRVNGIDGNVDLNVWFCPANP